MIPWYAALLGNHQKYTSSLLITSPALTVQGIENAMLCVGSCKPENSASFDRQIVRETSFSADYLYKLSEDLSGSPKDDVQLYIMCISIIRHLRVCSIPTWINPECMHSRASFNHFLQGTVQIIDTSSAGLPWKLPKDEGWSSYILRQNLYVLLCVLL